MPPVFDSKRSQILLQFLKLLVPAFAVLTLILISNSQPATVKTTGKPVLALSGQETEPSLPPEIQAAIFANFSQNPDAIPDQILIDDEDLQAEFNATSKSLTPDDTFARQQWSLHHDPDVAGSSGLFGSYDYLTGSQNIVVAVVDSGVILQHEDLNFLPGYDFIHNPSVSNDGDGRDHDPSDPGDWVNQNDITLQTVNPGCPIGASKWHGTAIAGIIGATPYNSTGIAGGSPSVSMLPVRVTGKCGGYVSDLIDGIRWAAGLEVNGVAHNQHPAQVINLSIGFPGNCSNAVQQAINDAANAGAILVTAATNSAVNLDNEPYSPASCNNVLTVAATDRNGAITPYTALGRSVFISAPGGTASNGIITTQNDGAELPLPGNYYGYQYGTSIAAAHVSAAVANMLAYQPALNQTEIRQVLSASSTPNNLDPKCTSGQCGAGSLNAVAAMELLASNFLDDAETTRSEPDSLATDNPAPVQLATAGSADTANESVVSTTTSDDVWTGSTDWRLLCLLLLLLLPQMYCKRRA